MRFRIVEALGVKPSMPLPSRALAVPSGAVIELNVNEDALRVVAPGSYAFEVGHVIETASELSAEDLLFISYVTAALLSVLFDGTRETHHRTLMERQLPFIRSLVPRAIATNSAFLLVAPSSTLMPILLGVLPSEVVSPMIMQAAATAAPLVLLLERGLLATTIEHASGGKDFEAAAKALRAPTLSGIAEVPVVTAIGEHLGLVLLDVLPAPSPGPPS